MVDSWRHKPIKSLLMIRKMATRIVIFFFFQAFVLLAMADVRLPRLVGDGMVLQYGVDLTIWGWADPGESVTITLAGKTGKSRTASAGRWRTILPAMDAGGPDTLTVPGKNEIVIAEENGKASGRERGGDDG